MKKEVSTYEFSQVVGKEIAKKAIAAFGGGTRIYLSDDPLKLDFPDQESKEKHIKQLHFDKRMSILEISEMTGLTGSRIMKIINKR